MQLLMLLIYLAISAIICFGEYCSTRKIFSPLILFVVPLSAVIVIQNIFCNWLQLALPSIHFYFIFIYFYMVMFLIGVLSKYTVGQIAFNGNAVGKEVPGFRTWGIIFPILCIVHFLVLFRGTSILGRIVQEDFQYIYTGGIWFYFRLLSIIYAAYYACEIKKLSFKNIIIILISLLPIFLTFVKGVIFIAVLACIVSNMIYNHRKLKLKTIMLAIVIGVGIFFSVYLIENIVWNPERLYDIEVYKQILAKLASYLMSGVEAFNINLNHAESFRASDNILYAPYINLLYNLGFLRDRIDTIGTLFTYIGYIPNYGAITSNTNTYVGMIYLHAGLVEGLFPHFINCMILYYLYYRLDKASRIGIVAFAVYSTGFILAWFDYYFSQTFWWYLLFFCGVFGILQKFKFPRFVIKKNS